MLDEGTVDGISRTSCGLDRVVLDVIGLFQWDLTLDLCELSPSVAEMHTRLTTVPWYTETASTGYLFIFLQLVLLHFIIGPMSKILHLPGQ